MTETQQCGQKPGHTFLDPSQLSSHDPIRYQAEYLYQTLTTFLQQVKDFIAQAERDLDWMMADHPKLKHIAGHLTVLQARVEETKKKMAEIVQSA